MRERVWEREKGLRSVHKSLLPLPVGVAHLFGCVSFRLFVWCCCSGVNLACALASVVQKEPVGAGRKSQPRAGLVYIYRYLKKPFCVI
jgi:hypothetical protein